MALVDWLENERNTDFRIKVSDIISSYISNTKVSQKNISTIVCHLINYVCRNVQEGGLVPFERGGCQLCERKITITEAAVVCKAHLPST